jgi:hypothetical protein
MTHRDDRERCRDAWRNGGGLGSTRSLFRRRHRELEVVFEQATVSTVGDGGGLRDRCSAVDIASLEVVSND